MMITHTKVKMMLPPRVVCYEGSNTQPIGLQLESSPYSDVQIHLDRKNEVFDQTDPKTQAEAA